MMISVVTMTGRINTWMKYILVTVLWDNDDPENNSVAMYFPISGVALARLMPMTAAPYASVSTEVNILNIQIQLLEPLAQLQSTS